MTNKIYITETFYNNLENKINNKQVDQKYFNRLKIYIKELASLSVDDIINESILVDNILSKRVFNNCHLLFIKESNNLYLFDVH